MLRLFALPLVLAVFHGFGFHTVAVSDSNLVPLPAEWTGVYNGTTTRFDNGKHSEVGMEMRIRPISGTVNTSWVILYTGEPVRDYILAPLADAPLGARFVVDELSGILLDHHLEGNVLHSSFAIGFNLMSMRYALTANKQIDVSMSIFDTSNPRKTNAGSIVVSSFTQKVVQYGVLKKVS